MDHNLGSTSSDHDSFVPDLSGIARHEELPQFLVTAATQELPILRTVEPRYIHAVDYRTHGFANCFTDYDKTVTSYISKVLKKVKSQMIVDYAIL